MEGGGRSYPSSPAPHLPTPPGVLTQEQRAKLQSELDLVQSNQAVFGELLNEMKPGQEQHPSELELLQVSLRIFHYKSFKNMKILGIKHNVP